MGWHALFPWFAFAYAWLSPSDQGRAAQPPRAVDGLLMLAVAGATIVVALGVVAATLLSEPYLPRLMTGHQYRSTTTHGVLLIGWAAHLLALVTLVYRTRLARRMQLWLAVTLLAMLIDLGLSAMLINGRYQFGWYLGRMYGLFGASFVLAVLMSETMALYGSAVRSAAALRSFYESAPLMMGIAELDGDRIVAVSANRATSEFFAKPPAAIIGQLWETLGIPPEVERHWIEQYRRSQREGTPVRFEYEHASGNRHCWLSVAVGFIGLAPSGRPRFSFVAEDVTVRKEHEAQLYQADVRKNEFLAMLGHELRNPLAAVKGGVQLLQVDKVREETRLMAVPIISQQVDHMARLIDDLQDVGRMIQGKFRMRFEPIVLQDVIAQAITMVDEVLQRKSCTVATELPSEPIVLSGDAVRLAQVFSNILTNAAKYSSGSCQVRVQAMVESREVAVSIRDNGVGISPELLPHVFDLFVQSKRSLDRADGGLGLGLNLVQRIVEAHGGRVEALSAGEGEGSEFVVHLPLQGAGR
jgi:PAS domain S-box-containing protein